MAPDAPTRVPLGRSGLMVSRVGLGCNNFGRPASATADLAGTRAVIDSALENGVTFFDTADVYGAEKGLSERLIGEALGGRRDEVVLATKFGLDMAGEYGPDGGARASRRYIRLAVEGSLRRLRTDWIDLYQQHEPDPFTPIEETLDTLGDLVREGKVRYLGSSNFAGWQIAEAELTARMRQTPPFVSSQNEYNLLRRGAEREVLPAVAAFGLSLLPFYPLFNGVFTGKFTRNGGPADSRVMISRPQVLHEVPWERFETFREWCGSQELSILSATFGWLLAQPGVASVIAGVTHPEQITQNVSAGTTVLTPVQVADISAFFPAAA